MLHAESRPHCPAHRSRTSPEGSWPLLRHRLSTRLYSTFSSLSWLLSVEQMIHFYRSKRDLVVSWCVVPNLVPNVVDCCPALLPDRPVCTCSMHLSVVLLACVDCDDAHGQKRPIKASARCVCALQMTER